MSAPSKAAVSEFTPTGKLRVGLNMSNFLLTAKDAAGAPIGLAPDLGRELGKRLGVDMVLVPYPNPGALAEDAGNDKWDVGFLGAEPQRANQIDFTPAYVEIESTYLVPPGSNLATVAAVDAKGIRIAVPEKSAYELWLSRNIKNAELVRVNPRLITDHANYPGSRILDGNFTAVQQAAGTPKGRPAAAQYLRDYIEDVKASGLVARLIEKNNVRGLTVAAKA